jgi:hypothetical protein
MRPVRHLKADSGLQNAEISLEEILGGDIFRAVAG